MNRNLNTKKILFNFDFLIKIACDSVIQMEILKYFGN